MHTTIFQKLLEKITVVEKEKDDTTKRLEEQVVSLENEFEVRFHFNLCFIFLL